MPFWPKLTWQVAQINAAEPNPAPTQQLAPETNTLYVPRLDLEEEIHEGQSAATVNKGVWRIPGTSTPGEQNNTVLAGHRFTYRGSSVFYHLDKLQLDDEVTVAWNGEYKNYKITEIKEVEATEVSIQDPTETERLTIFTCTPLLTAANRLVVIAEPIKEDNNEQRN